MYPTPQTANSLRKKDNNVPYIGPDDTFLEFKKQKQLNSSTDKAANIVDNLSKNSVAHGSRSSLAELDIVEPSENDPEEDKIDEIKSPWADWKSTVQKSNAVPKQGGKIS